MQGEDGYKHNSNVEGETSAQRGDGSVFGEKSDHNAHTYLGTSGIDSKRNSEDVYAAIPENCAEAEEGEGKADDNYTYAYGDMPNRGTTKKEILYANM